MSNKENDIFMANRLKEIRIHKGLNQKDFAKKIGMSRSGYSQIETGDRPISERLILSINLAFPEININWLRTNEGKMIIEKEDNFLEQLTKKYNLSPVEAQIADYCLNLSSEERAGILKHILNIAHIIQHNNSIDSINIQDTKLTKEEKLKILSKQLDAEEKGEILEVSTGINGWWKIKQSIKKEAISIMEVASGFIYRSANFALLGMQILHF